MSSRTRAARTSFFCCSTKVFGRDPEPELQERLEGVVVELAVLLEPGLDARHPQADDLGVGDLLLDLVVADDQAQPIGLVHQELTVDQTVQDHLFEPLLAGQLGRELTAPHQQEAVPKVARLIVSPATRAA